MVKHIPPFSFGDSMEVIKAWRHVLVEGEPEQMDRFLNEVDQRFKTLGWLRDTNLENQWNQDQSQRTRFYCWSNSPNRPQAMLCLSRRTERRVRGGTYDLRDERATIAELANTIHYALTEVLEPAAKAVQLTITYPYLGPISRTGSGTEAASQALAAKSDGQWPLSEALEPLWRRFVVTALHEDVAIKPEELTAWFMASGWNEHAAQELTRRFYADATLLREYEDGRQPA